MKRNLINAIICLIPISLLSVLMNINCNSNEKSFTVHPSKSNIQDTLKKMGFTIPEKLKLNTNSKIQYEFGNLEYIAEKKDQTIHLTIGIIQLKEPRNFRKVYIIGDEKEPWIVNEFNQVKYTLDSSIFGLEIKYLSKGNIESIVCIDPTYDTVCGKQIIFNPNNTIKEHRKFKSECNLGCGNIYTLFNPGNYITRSNSIRIREKPDINSKILTTLNKDISIEVIENTNDYQRISEDVAPWLKVKYGNQEGYVFGSLIRKKEDIDFDLIYNNQLEWNRLYQKPIPESFILAEKKKKEDLEKEKEKYKGLGIPDDAIDQGSFYNLRQKKGLITIYNTWYKEGDYNIEYKFGNFQKNLNFNPLKKKKYISIFAPGYTEFTHDAPELSPMLFGYYTQFHDDESVKNLHCEIEKFSNGISQGMDSHNSKCQDEILLNPDGSIKDVITHPYKCTQYCGDFVPLRDNGEYLVNLDKTVVHEKPSKSSKKLAELSRNERVNVIEDSGKIETILPHTATWGKVKTSSGIEGYVFGAYIRTEDEVDYEGIKEKARNWKKVNGKK